MRPLLIATLAAVSAATLSATASEPFKQALALELAKDTLATVQAADSELQQALKSGDRKRYEELVREPLRRVVVRWRQAPHLTDRDKFTFQDCLAAATGLMSMSWALLDLPDPDSDWATFKLNHYREDVAACKMAIRNPDGSAVK